MKLNGYIKKIIPILMLLIFLGYGCDETGIPTTIPTTPTTPTVDTVSDPTQPGPHRTCTYTQGLADLGYKNAKVFYPCDLSAPVPATTLTGGWTNEKEEMDWIGNQVSTWGYIAISMTPNNKMGNNPQWVSAHNAGIAKLKSENNRQGSPIYGMVKTDALQIMGYSKGGGGTLLAANQQGANIKSAQALAPYIDSPTYNLRNIQAATILYTGTDDTVAPPQRVVGMYQNVPASVTKTLVYFNGVGHLAWWNGGGAGGVNNHNKIFTYMIPWMEVYLKGDTRYVQYLDGSQGWFFRFEHSDGYGTGGGGTGGVVNPGCGF